MRLILLPGLDGTGVLLDRLSEELAKAHDVEPVRYPGDRSSYEDVARWLRPRLPAGDFGIVAESFSGPLAIMLATERPAGLKALVLVASFARSPQPVPSLFSAILYLLPIRSELLIRMTRSLLVGQWGAKSFPRDFARIIRSVPRQTLARRLHAVLRVNVVDALKAVAIPRLLVISSADALVPAGRNQEFRAAGWNVVTVEGPHFLNLTRPEEVASVIDAFLSAR